MAKIPETSLIQYTDGDKVYAIDYNRDREVIRVAVNDIEDKLASTTDNNSGADNVKITSINGVVGTNIQQALESLKAQVNLAIEGIIPDGSVTEAKLSNTILGSRVYSSNNVVMDNEPVGDSLNKIDLHLGSKELSFTKQDTTIYVNPTTGVNTKLAGTEFTPYKTIQYALDQLPKIVNHNITVRLNAGTYNEVPKVTGFTGSGKIRIQGDEDSPSSYVVMLITLDSFLRTEVVGVMTSVAHSNILGELEARITALEGGE